jgi:hypothetical protein
MPWMRAAPAATNISGTGPGIDLCHGYGCDSDCGCFDCQTKARWGYPTTSWPDRREGDYTSRWNAANPWRDLVERFLVFRRVNLLCDNDLIDFVLIKRLGSFDRFLIANDLIPENLF